VMTEQATIHPGRKGIRVQRHRDRKVPA
jgi:hypothetical protein